MGENKWSNARRQKRKMQQEMAKAFEREYLLDDEEKDNRGKKKG